MSLYKSLMVGMLLVGSVVNFPHCSETMLVSVSMSMISLVRGTSTQVAIGLAGKGSSGMYVGVTQSAAVPSTDTNFAPTRWQGPSACMMGMRLGEVDI